MRELTESDRKLATLPDDHPVFRDGQNQQLIRRREQIREQIAAEEQQQ